MKAVKFKLADHSKFSVKDGRGRLLDIIPSDTIFSALINNINLIYGDQEATRTVEKFKNDELSISSMFIGLDFYHLPSNQLIDSLYFLPRPEGLIEASSQGDQEKKEDQVINRKKAKAITMLSLASLRKLGQTWDGEAGRFDFDLLELELIGSSLACSREELEGLEGLEVERLKELSFSQDISNPHVRINRFTGGSEDFYYGDEKRFFHQYTPNYRIEPFMYLLYKGDLNKETRAGLNLIVDEGLGGKRSIGMGGFISNQYIELDMEDSQDARIFMGLSTYVPTREEYEEVLGYQLARADGYLYYKGGLPFRKKSIGIIKEGGISRIRAQGSLVDVTPAGIGLENRIYFNGKSFTIGLGGGGHG